ncbi:HNH endonuclease signature motif containing protein [Streptococcus hyovaginalis]|uniref:HNH endonuclease signature motif containing protein n=1 Tax=Streptococcus hyovaginalis TaxID=149015 RepID=UPI001478F385|nr:HNH endonuclease signature motif containing protein [Streptococcus hyovaginalis]
MARLLTAEQHEYFVRVQKGRSAKEVAKVMNVQFGICLDANQIRNYRRNHGLKSGLTGQFEKGRIPHNKGKKYPNMPPNSGQFKKGSKPINRVPVGTIRYTTDGYPKIKIAEPNIWKQMHRKVWEEHHGPIPSGHSVVFLDGNKRNCHIDNLTILKNSELARMNQNHYFAENPELTRAGIGVVKIKNKLQELKNDHNH